MNRDESIQPRKLCRGNRLTWKPCSASIGGMPQPLTHPDRLLPADSGVRRIARSLLESVQGLPILVPHGHVGAAVIEQNTPFPDPAALLGSPDHYVTRLIHASGVRLERLRTSADTQPNPREVWREFCKAWPLFDG